MQIQPTMFDGRWPQKCLKSARVVYPWPTEDNIRGNGNATQSRWLFWQ
jgi:hypothetical protein